MGTMDRRRGPRALRLAGPRTHVEEDISDLYAGPLVATSDVDTLRPLMACTLLPVTSSIADRKALIEPSPSSETSHPVVVTI